MTLLLILFQNEIWLPLFFHKDIILLTCTELETHTKSQMASNSPATNLILHYDEGDNLQTLDKNPDSSRPNERPLCSQDVVTQTMKCELLLLFLSIYNVHPKTVVPSY